MNINDNINYAAEYHKLLRSHRQKCLMCKDDWVEEVTACTDFSCPLWLNTAIEPPTTQDFEERAQIYLETCKKIYEQK